MLPWRIYGITEPTNKPLWAVYVHAENKILNLSSLETQYAVIKKKKLSSLITRVQRWVWPMWRRKPFLTPSIRFSAAAKQSAIMKNYLCPHLGQTQPATDLQGSQFILAFLTPNLPLPNRGLPLFSVRPPNSSNRFPSPAAYRKPYRYAIGTVSRQSFGLRRVCTEHKRQPTGPTKSVRDNRQRPYRTVQPSTERSRNIQCYCIQCSTMAIGT